MFIFEQIRTGGDRNFAYLIGDADAKTAVIVDPSYDPEAVVGRAKDQQLAVTHVINTHGHPDHTNGNAKAMKLTGAKLLAYKTAASRPDVTVDHEDTLAVGAFTLKFLFTPGHADDHICVLVDDVCLTGDVLFVGKVGGTSGREAAETEYRSLHNVVLKLPDDTTIWPGHDYGCRPSSTIGLERRTNPFLLAGDLDAFLDLKNNWAAFKAERGLI